MISAGCATDRARLGAAAKTKAGADAVGTAVVIAGQAQVEARQLPDYPAECRKRERSGVKLGESKTVALQKTDNALTRANVRTVNCAAWYDTLKAEREKA